MPISFNEYNTAKIRLTDKTGQRHTINVDKEELKMLKQALNIYDLEHNKVRYRHEINPYTIRNHIEDLLDEESSEFTGLPPLPAKDHAVLESFLSLDEKTQNKIASRALYFTIERDFKEEFYNLMDKVVDRTTERIMKNLLINTNLYL